MKKRKTYRSTALQILVFALFGVYLINVFHQNVSSLAHTIAHKISSSAHIGHHITDHHSDLPDQHTQNAPAKEHQTHHAHTNSAGTQPAAHGHKHLTEEVKGHEHSHSFLALFKVKVLAEKVPSTKNVSLADLEFDKHVAQYPFSLYFPTKVYISHFYKGLYLLTTSHGKIPTPPPQS